MTHYYYHQDHLGNICAVWDATHNGKLKGDYGFATWISRYTHNKSTEYFIYVRNHELVPYKPIP